MQRLSAGALVLGITALLAAGLMDPLTTTGGTIPRVAPVAVPADAAQKSLEPRTARELLEDAVGSARLPSTEVDVVFLHVPDPVDSSLDWSYDGMLFALRKAFECTDFVADRRWMPWPHDRREIQRGFGLGLDLDPGLRHSHPGVMLFRQRRSVCRSPEIKGSGKDPTHCWRSAEWLVVFVVGEDPLTGVHPKAFKNALSQRDVLVRRPGGGSEESVPLHVVGPAFAGSMASILRSIEPVDPGESRPELRFISGSATGPELDTAASDVDVHRTVHSDREREHALANVLRGLALDASRVALLQESTTRRSHDPSIAPVVRSGEFFDQVLVIPFPLSIASLRNTRDRVGVGLWQPPTWRRASVPMPLSSPLRPGAPATPQGFSTLTPPAVDLLIDEIAQVLRHEGIRAVVISATDVRDTIFLGTELRSRIRGLRLFTLRNNLLYLRPEQHDALRGMVVVSTYPLMPANRHPFGQQRHLLFPSEESEGVFNATALVLRRIELESDLPQRGAARDDPSMNGARFLELVTYDVDDVREPVNLDSGGAFSASRWLTPVPDLWVSVVGARSILPIKTCLSCAEAKPTREALKRPLSRTELSRVALFGIFVFSVGILSRLLKLEEWRIRDGWSLGTGDSQSATEGLCMDHLTSEQKIERRRTSLIRRYGTSAEDTYSLLRWAVVISNLLPHSAFIWYFCVADGESLQSLPWPSTATVVLVISCLAMALAFVKILVDGLTEVRNLRCLLREAKDLLQDKPKFLEWWSLELGSQVALFSLVGVSHFLMVGLYSYAIARGQLDTASDLVFFRSVQIDNGVSPLLTLTLVGAFLLLWTSWHIRRLERLSKETPFGIALHEHPAGHKDRYGTSAPVDHREGKYFPICFLADSAIKLRAHLFFGPPPVIFGVPPRRTLPHLLWIVPSIGWLWWSFGTTVEALVLPSRLELFSLSFQAEFFGVNAFDVLLRSGVLLTQLALCLALYRFTAVVVGLRDLLKRLATTPLITAFERLPKRISRLARLPLFAQPGSWMVRATSNQGYQYLQQVGALVDDGVETNRTADSMLRGLILRARLSIEDSPVESPDSEAKPQGDLAKRRMNRRLSFEANCRRSNHLHVIESVLTKQWARQPTHIEATRIEKTLREPSEKWSDIASVGSQVQRRFPDGAEGLWLRTAEELYALEVVGYLESVLKQLQRMILFLFPAILVTGMLIGSYPFEPQGLMSTFFIALVITTVSVFLWVMVVLNRDEVLNRLSHSDPRRFTWHGTFVLNLVIVIAVGLLALISTEYPAVWHLFLGWFRPLLEAVVN